MKYSRYYSNLYSIFKRDKEPQIKRRINKDERKIREETNEIVAPGGVSIHIESNNPENEAKTLRRIDSNTAPFRDFAN